MYSYDRSFIMTCKGFLERFVALTSSTLIIQRLWNRKFFEKQELNFDRNNTFWLTPKFCTGRESNPGLPRGRREFYHWTTSASRDMECFKCLIWPLLLDFESIPIISKFIETFDGWEKRFQLRILSTYQKECFKKLDFHSGTSQNVHLRFFAVFVCFFLFLFVLLVNILSYL